MHWMYPEWLLGRNIQFHNLTIRLELVQLKIVLELGKNNTLLHFIPILFKNMCDQPKEQRSFLEPHIWKTGNFE